MTVMYMTANTMQLFTRIKSYSSLHWGAHPPLLHVPRAGAGQPACAGAWPRVHQPMSQALLGLAARPTRGSWFTPTCWRRLSRQKPPVLPLTNAVSLPPSEAS